MLGRPQIVTINDSSTTLLAPEVQFSKWDDIRAICQFHSAAAEIGGSAQQNFDRANRVVRLSEYINVNFVKKGNFERE
jgi:hypothetical protein